MPEKGQYLSHETYLTPIREDYLQSPRLNQQALRETAVPARSAPTPAFTRKAHAKAAARCRPKTTNLQRNTKRMIETNVVRKLVDEWLKDKDYFLTDLTISPDDRIVVEIDHQDGVWIEDCVELSRFIEAGLDRDAEDFELEVGSAGIGQPFKVLKQYEIHEGESVEVLTKEGKKMEGTLSNVTPEHFTITVQEKVRPEGKKRPVLVDRDITLAYDDVKYTKYVIKFK